LSNKEPLNYFSDRGENYEKYRPIHPDAAIAQIVAGLPASDSIIAVDVGAGTGIGARSLADRGLRVIAIEPNADMRTAAKPHERVEFMDGTAEQIPVESAFADLVTSFQAFHWFDFDKSLQEFQRVLKPGGRLALIWSFWDQTDPTTKQYSQLIDTASKERSRQAAPPTQPATWFKKLRYQLFWQGLWLPYFINLLRFRFTFHQSLDLTGLIGLARSQGFTPNSGEDLEKLIAELAQFYQQTQSTDGLVRLNYVTHLYLATPES